MQRTVGGGSKGGGVVGGCRFLLSTPSVHIKVLRVERMSSAVHVVGLNQSVEIISLVLTKCCVVRARKFVFLVFYFSFTRYFGLQLPVNDDIWPLS